MLCIKNIKFNLSDGSYQVSNTQDVYVHIIKKHETVTDNPSIGICVNKIENRITFKIKTWLLCRAFNALNNEITWKH